MTGWRLAATLVLLLTAVIVVESAPGQQTETQPADVTVFRVFLKDGTGLVSYGEVARVGDRVLFSMPTNGSVATPELQLVDLAADRVDWDRTERYAHSARAAHYLQHRAALDYLQLSNEVAQTLETVALTKDPALRLSIVETARKKLADWPKTHYNYKDAEVQQMLSFLDGAIADLRTSTGAQQFSLNFVSATPASPALVPLLPPPSLRESIELTLRAATATDLTADRTLLLSAALKMLERNASRLPGGWASTTTASTKAALEREKGIDRAYRDLSTRLLRTATRRARAADIRGVERVLSDARARDAALGGRRPDVVNALVAAVEDRIKAAEQLQEARTQWATRLPSLKEYRATIDLSLIRFQAIVPWLDDIRSLAGSPPSTLRGIQRTAERIITTLETVSPPDELKVAHALFASAANLASNAAQIRGDAARGANIARAWDASAAAAGALMLGDQARSEIATMLRTPQLPR